MFDRGTETEFFSNAETRDWRISDQFTYNLANVNQKLGFSVIGGNMRYLTKNLRILAS